MLSNTRYDLNPRIWRCNLWLKWEKNNNKNTNRWSYIYGSTYDIVYLSEISNSRVREKFSTISAFNVIHFECIVQIQRYNSAFVHNLLFSNQNREGNEKHLIIIMLLFSFRFSLSFRNITAWYLLTPTQSDRSSAIRFKFTTCTYTFFYSLYSYLWELVKRSCKHFYWEVSDFILFLLSFFTCLHSSMAFQRSIKERKRQREKKEIQIETNRLVFYINCDIWWCWSLPYVICPMSSLHVERFCGHCCNSIYILIIYLLLFFFICRYF